VRNPNPAPGGAPPRRVDLSTADVYEVRDSSDPNRLFCRAWVNQDGLLQTEMHTVADGNRSTVLDFLQIMGEIDRKFGQRAKGIFATWAGSWNTNIQKLNEAIQKGMPLEKAVFQTVEGMAAKRAGFTEATVVSAIQPSSTPGQYFSVQVHFSRPGVAP
jgi:hypothetical protein